MMRHILAVAFGVILLVVGNAPCEAAEDGLSEVNAKRAARGLKPFVRDEGLTQAAGACAEYRARHLMFGHTSNDFAFCPSGVRCDATGCAAYPAHYGWLSCCTYDAYTHAGAAYVTGGDGKRYMHLFVRSGGSAAAAPLVGCPCGACPCVILESPACPGGCPASTVNTTADYPTVYRLVQLGCPVAWEGTPPGLPRGIYDCWLDRGVPVMQPRSPLRPIAAAPDCPPGG